MEAHFGVGREQIEHDFVISHVLAAIAPESDRFVIYGGTALSRTILDGFRLSEDIDLLSVGSRREPAERIDSHMSVIEAWAKATEATESGNYQRGGFGIHIMGRTSTG